MHIKMKDEGTHDTHEQLTFSMNCVTLLISLFICTYIIPRPHVVVSTLWTREGPKVPSVEGLNVVDELHFVWFIPNQWLDRLVLKKRVYMCYLLNFPDIH